MSSVDVSRKRGALSVALNGSQGGDVVGEGFESSQTVQLSRSLGRPLGGVETSVAVAAASLQSVFNLSTGVRETKPLADGARVTGVEVGNDAGSVVESTVESDHGTLSITCHPSSIGNTFAADEETRVAGDRVLRRVYRAGCVDSLKIQNI